MHGNDLCTWLLHHHDGREEWPFTTDEALQHCHPCSCSHFKVSKSSLVQIFGWAATRCSLWWQLITLQVKPPPPTPPLNDWASVMSCQLWLGLPAKQTLMSVGLSDLWVIGHRAHFVTSTRAFLYGYGLTWKRETWSGRGRLWVWTYSVEEMWPLGATVRNHMYTHVLVMYCHMCSQSSAHHLLLLQGAIFELRRCLSL